VPAFTQGLQERLRSQHTDVIGAIRGGDWSDDTQSGLRRAIGQFADDFGHDLDEEGQPLEGHEQRHTRTDGNGSGATDGGRAATQVVDGDGDGGRDRGSEPAAVVAR
jgi:F-type H+-transporting ATPase subunit alpha